MIDAYSLNEFEGKKRVKFKRRHLLTMHVPAQPVT